MFSSIKCLDNDASISLSHEQSPSRIITYLPIASFTPKFSEEARPPRIFFDTIFKSSLNIFDPKIEPFKKLIDLQLANAIDKIFLTNKTNLYSWCKNQLPNLKSNYKPNTISIILKFPQDPAFRDFYTWIENTLPDIKSLIRKSPIIKQILNIKIPQEDSMLREFLYNFYTWIENTLPDFIEFFIFINNNLRNNVSYINFDEGKSFLEKFFPELSELPEEEKLEYLTKNFDWVKRVSMVSMSNITKKILQTKIPKDPKFRNFFVQFYNWIEKTLDYYQTSDYSVFSIANPVLAIAKAKIPQDVEFQKRLLDLCKKAQTNFPNTLTSSPDIKEQLEEKIKQLEEELNKENEKEEKGEAQGLLSKLSIFFQKFVPKIFQRRVAAA